VTQTEISQNINPFKKKKQTTHQKTKTTFKVLGVFLDKQSCADFQHVYSWPSLINTGES